MGEKGKPASKKIHTGAKGHKRMKVSIAPSEFRGAVIAGLHTLREQFDSDSALARATGVSQPTINKVLSGKQDPRLEAVGKLMDAAGAKIVFPWDKRDRTRRIAFGKPQDGNGRYLAIIRYKIGSKGGGLQQSSGGQIILDRSVVEKVSSSLDLGVVRFEEHMPGMSPCLYPGDDMLVDFSMAPEERAEVFLVRLPEGRAVAARCFLEERENLRSLILFWEDKALLPRCLLEGKDFFQLSEVVLGKVIFVMGGLQHRL